MSATSSYIPSVLGCACEIVKNFKWWGNNTILKIAMGLKYEMVNAEYDFLRNEAARLLHLFEEEMANRAIEELLCEC